MGKGLIRLYENAVDSPTYHPLEKRTILEEKQNLEIGRETERKKGL